MQPVISSHSNIPGEVSSPRPSGESCLQPSGDIGHVSGSGSLASQSSVGDTTPEALAATVSEKDSAAGDTTMPMLTLPAPNHLIEESADSAMQLTLGQRVSLQDELGPLVVNSDGTVARISNWKQMTEGERSNVLRVLGKRNKERLGALKEQAPRPQ